MTNGTEIQKKSAMQELANRLQVSVETLQKTLKATAFKDCKTNEEFIAAVIVANTYQLNPLLGEIYAFPGKKGGVTPIVPIDGWISMMNRHKNANGELDHDGLELIENRSKDGSKNLSKTDVDSITAKIYTKGKTHPTIVTEYMVECFDGNKSPWVKWPIRMLRHKALIQCARVAYGFSGIYDPDEGERIAEAHEIHNEPALIEMPRAKETVAAEAVSPKEPPVMASEKQLQNLEKIAEQAGLVEGDYLDFLHDQGIQDSQMSLEEYQKALNAVMQKIDSSAKDKVNAKSSAKA